MRTIILFAHGARDVRWSDALAALRDRLQRLAQEVSVTTAFLEFQTPTLNDALEDALQRGASELIIVPVFWARGGHVLDDLPTQIEAFRQKHAAVDAIVLPVLSELPGLLDFVASAVLHAANTKSERAAR